MALLQMTWQPSLLNQKRKTGPPLGLRNLGNTCYLNSVLQCLTYTPPLANFCLKYLHSSSCDSVAVATEKKGECPFCILEKRIARSLSSELVQDSPLKINNCLKIFAQHFRLGRQEDAHEFLRYVIDSCHNTCLKLKKLQQQRRKNGSVGGAIDGSSSTIVKEIFGGALQSQVKCLSCGAESNKIDEIMDISLDVLHCSSLKEALQKFFQPEVLDGNNRYKCESCKKLVAARKQMSILQAPNVLVIQLKRFEGIYGGKIDKLISFEDVLLLSGYMCKGSEDAWPEYNLFGTIVHSGFSSDSGHYYAYIKDAIGRWYCCNDSCVSISTLQEVLAEKVYILFFTRTKQRPPRNKVRNLTNGKSHESNGSASKMQKPGYQEKSVNGKQSVYQHSDRSKSTCSKSEKSPKSPTRRIGVFDNSSSEMLPANGNIKFVVHTKELTRKSSTTPSCEKEDEEKILSTAIERNGVSKMQSVPKRNGASNMPSVTETEGFSSAQSVPERNGINSVRSITDNDGVRSKSVDIVGQQSKTLPSANGSEKYQNGTIQDGELCAQNGEVSSIRLGTTGSKEVPKGNAADPAVEACLKRKNGGKDPCVLLCKDALSCAEVEKFTDGLRKDSKLALKSCGWTSDVYNFMHARKKLCLGEAGNDALNDREIKRLLIADARRTFNSKIPESVKADLIEQLRSFSDKRVAGS